MNTTATTHDATSAIPTTQKIPPAYSPALERANPTGRNPTAVTSVPDSIGNAVEVLVGPGRRLAAVPVVAEIGRAFARTTVAAVLGAGLGGLGRDRVAPADAVAADVDRGGGGGCEQEGAGEDQGGQGEAGQAGHRGSPPE